MKKLFVVLIILFSSIIYISAQEDLPSYKGIQLGDPIDKAISILGEPMKVSKAPHPRAPENALVYRYIKDKTIIIIATESSEIIGISISYPDPIPYTGLNLDDKGFKSYYDDDGIQCWIKTYEQPEYNIIELYKSKSGYNGLIENRSIVRRQKK
jgi:hypothetical protein